MKNNKMMCPICSRGGTLQHKGTRDDSSIDVYKCTECGTKYLSVINENDYENGFMHESDNILSNLDIGKRLEESKEDDERRCDMVKYICKGKNVLDFGCGFGGFLDNISKVSKLCDGVELGKIERKYLEDKGVKVYKTIDECGEKKYDVITLFHVFEHLNNPQMWLDKIGNYVVEGGHLVIEVPNANDALLSLYECEKFADFTYWSAHLFLYTKKSLSMVIERDGKFDIESAGQVQRYPLSNHLMWLSKGKNGGQVTWNMMNSEELEKAYKDKLEELDMCDTLFFVLKKKY
jgi:2-polyprenyl-3-methyl-5-hydroxy-6-metoxy-1,4-benzoquinol methylase